MTIVLFYFMTLILTQWLLSLSSTIGYEIERKEKQLWD